MARSVPGIRAILIPGNVAGPRRRANGKSGRNESDAHEPILRLHRHRLRRAGGAAAAWRLAKSGARVLLLEKGEALPTDGSTLDVEQVIRQARFKSREVWLNKNGKPFAPEEYFNVGGKTK